MNARHLITPLALLVAALGAAPLRAEEARQIPLSAIVAPQGSISSEGRTPLVVYLSWGVASGELPAGLSRFRLYRDGVRIGDWSATVDATAAQIDGFYSAAAQGRRKTEMARRLCEVDAYEVATEGNVPDCTGAALAPYEQTLGARLLVHLQNVRADLLSGRKDHPRSHVLVALATRLDPNVARARRLGHVERPPTTAGPVITYRLEAVRVIGGVETVVSLGAVEVANPATSAPIPVPAADGLRQVTPAERGAACDTPSSGLVQGTVALTWRHGGAASPIASWYADQLIVGYDLYRSERPLDTPQVQAGCSADIAALAGARAFDYATGEVTLPGLVRVNPAPILIVPGPGGDPTLALEERRDLEAAGFGPGDKACYHVVPRDITGNYGRTRSLLVTVDDVLAPPAPWDVEVVTESTADLVTVPGGSPQLASTDRFAIRWTHIDVAAYVADHQDGRTFCNLDRAVQERRVRVSDAPDTCASEFNEVNLAVAGYRVYRFDSVRLAEGFRDTDGDGVADADERAAASPTDPCDASSVPAPGALKGNGLPIEPASWQPAPDPSSAGPGGRRLVVFADAEPVAQKGKVYWYKVVPVTANGQAGEPSPAIRAFFPNEVQPLPPRLTLGETVCEHQAAVDGSDGAVLARDYTCKAKSVRLVCADLGLRECLAAWETEAHVEDIFPRCRPVLEQVPELGALWERVSLQGGVPSEVDRAEAGGILVAKIARDTLWEAPFGECPLYWNPELPRFASASISQTACERAVLPRALTDECQLAVQFVGADGRVIDVQWGAEHGLAERQVPIEDNPFFTPYEPTDPEAPDAGCWFSATLWENPWACEVRPVEDGQIVEGPVVLTAEVGAGECIDINEEVQRPAEPAERDDTGVMAGRPQYVGDLFRLGVACDDDEDGLIKVALPPQDNDEQLRCLKASAHSASNVVSALSAATCAKSVKAGLKPRPPRLDGFTFDAQGRAMLTWTRPAGTIAGVLVEWSRQGGGGYGTTFLGGDVGRATVTEEIAVFPAQSAPVSGEIWCLRARSIAGAATGGGASMSDWTSQRCATVGGPPVTPPGMLDSIPWPEPVVPTPGAPLEALYAPADGAFAVKLARADDALYQSTFGGWLSCADMNQASDEVCPAGRACVTYGSQMYCDVPACSCGGQACEEACLEPFMLGKGGLCVAVAALVREVGAFVVYRQERRPDQSIGPFVQVSARVEQPVCLPTCMQWTGAFNERYCLRPGYALSDPDLALARLSDNDHGARDLVFVDRFPFVADPGYAYRYELVFFDALGEITATRQSGWVSPSAP